MLSTLHGYILRELLKVFGLTLVAMTAVLSMAGALYNLLQYEGITATDLFAILPLLLPIVLTVALPVSALFAGTMVYGRLASDNEFTACRAAGINVHGLFKPVLLLSLLIASITAVAVNYVIPDFARRIDRYVRGNIGEFAYQQLRSRGFVHYNKQEGQNYLVTAEAAKRVPAEVLVAHGFERPESGLSYFWVDQPRVLVVDGDAVRLFSTAEGGLCQFDNREGPVKFTLTLARARTIEMDRNVFNLEKQTFGPIELPIPFPERAALMTFDTLLDWRREPWLAREVDTELRKFLSRFCTEYFVSEVARRVGAGEPLTLATRDGRAYRITAGAAKIGERTLKLDRVIVEHRSGGGGTRWEAPEASLSVLDPGGTVLQVTGEGAGDRGAEATALPRLSLRLAGSAENPVIESPLGGRERGRRQRDVRFDPLDLPTDLLGPALAVTESQAVAREFPFELSPGASKDRAALVARTERLGRKVVATLNSRFCYATSALVTIIMGAILGMMFRGSQALAAFALSCVPLMAIILMMLFGNQMALNPGKAMVGLGVMWGGVAGLGLADLVLIRFGVAR